MAESGERSLWLRVLMVVVGSVLSIGAVLVVPLLDAGNQGDPLSAAVGSQVLLLGSGVAVFYLLALTARTLVQRGTSRRRPPRQVAEELALAVETALRSRLDTSHPRRRPRLRWTFAEAEDGQVFHEEDLPGLYGAMRDRRLVIVGDPGSGKTRLAHLLALGLLERRQPEDPVPVPLSIVTWPLASGHIDAWLADRLHDEYGLRREAAVELVSRQLVLPVFDGLDEIGAGELIGFLTQLARETLARTWRAGHVLTCRTDAAEATAGLFFAARRLGVTVRLLPLDPLEAIDSAVPQDEEGRARWRPLARAVAEDTDGPLARAFSSPLTFVLAAGAYEHRDPGELLDRERFAGSDEITRRIFELADPTANFALWRDADRRRWLAVATRAMGREDDDLLLWWRLAPMRAAKWAGPVVWLALLGLAALLLGTVGGARVVPAMLVAGLAMTLWAQPDTDLRPRRISGWVMEGPGWRRFLRRIAWWTRVIVTGAGSAAGAVLLLDRTANRPIDLVVPVVCLSAGLAFAFGVGAPDSDVTPRHARRTGDLTRDGRAALARAASLTVLVVFPISYWRWGDLSAREWTALAVAWLLVFTAALLGSAWGQYRLTHAWLAGSKRELPWRLRGFLDRAVAEGLLRSPEGYGTGCYVFSHALVRDSLVARGSGRNPQVDAVRRVWREVVDETLLLPESFAYVAYTSEGDPEGERRAVEHVVSLTSSAFDDDLPTIAEAGADAYARFQRAHRSMRAGRRPPWWAGPALTFAYGAVAMLGVTAALTVAASTVMGPAAIFFGWLVALFGYGLVLLVLDGRGIVSVPDVPGGSIAVRGMLLGLATSPLIAATVESFAPDSIPASPVLITAICTAFALLAYLEARPHAAAHQALRSEDPVDWPDLPGARPRYRDAALQARQDWLTALAREGVMPLLRNRLRVGQDPRNLSLPTIDPSRLTGIRRSDQFVATEAARRTGHHLRELESASIGVSGPRGAGKSSLMQRFCVPDAATAADDLLVLVPAPTSYDPREFLIHLFAEVCRGIIGDSGAADGRPGPEPGRRRTRAKRIGAVFAVVAGVATGIGALLWPRLTELGQEWSKNPRLLIGIGGAVLAVGGIVGALVLSGRAARAPERRTGGAEAEALRHLRSLHYQLTVMRTRTSQLALPAGLQLADAHQIQHTEQVLTYPEIVARFRSLLDLVALERRPLGGRVVIGIDELDKLGSAEEAERFLNDLKVVFGIQGCHFLVAVSEDALTAFGRHVLDVRTAFDSAFDKVVAVPPLDLEQARDLLELRGVWLPEPYLWLCQVLSGGLPRDLLRAVMSLATAKALRGVGELGPLAGELITEDAYAVLSAQSRHVASLTGEHAPAAARWAGEVSQAPVTPDSWERMIETAPLIPPDDFETRRAVDQVRAYLALGATLLRTFTDGDASDLTRRLDRLRSAGPGPVDRLTVARAKLAAEPDAAWAAVNLYRQEMPDLTTLVAPTV